MTPSEKEKIIKDSYDAIKDLYILRNELLTDAGKLEAAKESNRKLSDRVANLEVTIKSLNAAIDKKDVEIRALKATYEALEANRDAIYETYLVLVHKHDVDEYIKKCVIADNRKKKAEIKNLKEALVAEKEHHGCDKCVCSTLNENNAELESDFHELRQKLTDMYMTGTLRGFSTSDFTEFAKWFKDTFGDFGVYDE